mgnify:CR=1 FL=1
MSAILNGVAYTLAGYFLYILGASGWDNRAPVIAKAEKLRAYLARNWETTVLAYLASIVVLLEILILTAALDWNLAFMITAAVLILGCCAGIITALYIIERLNR